MMFNYVLIFWLVTVQNEWNVSLSITPFETFGQCNRAKAEAVAMFDEWEIDNKKMERKWKIQCKKIPSESKENQNKENVEIKEEVKVKKEIVKHKRWDE